MQSFKLWVKDGIVDTIIPQLYFGFEYPIREFCFDNLMDSWAELAAENKAVKLASAWRRINSVQTASPIRRMEKRHQILWLGKSRRVLTVKR